MRLAASVVNVLLVIYFLVLLARLVLEYIPLFNREWRPKGVGLVLAEVVYTLTDPPIKLFRRFVPPVRIGAVAIDLAFTFTMILVLVLMSITSAIAGR